MHLSWAVCHRDGAEKDWLWDRYDGEIRIELNGPITGGVGVHAEERVASQIHRGRTRMKTWMHFVEDGIDKKRLISNGLIVEPEAGDTNTFLPIVCQSFRLLNAHHVRIYKTNPLAGENDYEDFGWNDLYELSAFMWRLIFLADKRVRQLNSDELVADPAPTMGITQGVLADTGITKSWRWWDVNNTWDALIAKSSRRNAPDFELEPIDNENGNHAKFNTYYPMRGSDQSEKVVFELGINMVDVRWRPTMVDPQLCNRYILVGDGTGDTTPIWVAENHNSMKNLGLYSQMDSASEKDVGELEAKASAYVARHCYPVDIFDIVLPVEIGGQALGFSRNALGAFVPQDGGEYGVPPSYGVDYDVGDIVTIRVHDLLRFELADALPGPGTDITVRIIAVTLTEVDKDGNVAVTLEVQPWEDESGGVSGYSAYIVNEPEEAA